ncbi:MAG: hypothetical protein ACP5L1_03315 [Caldivirga sp.]|uniref:hypothetical protein n=1 Tax=Caldivirga sp. TaxID=2080243 RepID=UPI003D0CE641
MVNGIRLSNLKAYLIVALLLLLLLEVNLISMNWQAFFTQIHSNGTFLRLNESEGYALAMAALPNVKYEVKVNIVVLNGSVMVLLSNGSALRLNASKTLTLINLEFFRGFKGVGPSTQCSSSVGYIIELNGKSSVQHVSVNLYWKHPMSIIPVNLGYDPTLAVNPEGAISLLDKSINLCGSKYLLILVGLSNDTVVSITWSHDGVEA